MSEPAQSARQGNQSDVCAGENEDKERSADLCDLSGELSEPVSDNPSYPVEQEQSEWEIDGDALLDDLGFAAQTSASLVSGNQEQDKAESAEILAGMRLKVKELETQNAELRLSLGRLREEFENMRQRHSRLLDLDRELMQSDLMKQILPLMDNFDRAMEHATSGEVSEDFITGVVLLYKQLSDLLEQNRVVPIIAAGQFFNPELHEAVVAETSLDYEANMVIAEVEKGYTLGDRLLRPARVKVAVRPRANYPTEE